MNGDDFEGSIVLERLARVDLLDDFIAAVDSDDFIKVVKLMRSAGMDEPTIETVLRKMADPYDEH